MSWARMLLLGNVGQQMDIEDVEADVRRLRATIERLVRGLDAPSLPTNDAD